jgi:8-oxo-dGTP diphosphatase
VKYDSATPYIASFVVLRKGNKVAFVLREHTKWMNGYYGLPSGKVEKGESFRQAAVREAREEIGVEVSLDDLRYLHTTHRQSEDTEWIDIYFEVLKWDGEPVNNEPKVHGALEWLDTTDLPVNIVPPVRFALEQINDGEVYSEYGWEEN